MHSDISTFLTKFRLTGACCRLIWLTIRLTSSGPVVHHCVCTRLPHGLLERGGQALRDLSCKLAAHRCGKCQEHPLNKLSILVLHRWYCQGLNAT